MKQFKTKYVIGRRKQAGVTLLIIIIGMLVIAVLGVALYTLTFTTTLNQVIAQRAARAFYLAESGIRIAASEYKAALGTSTTNADTKLANLNAKTFSMTNNQGQIKIELYPYWFYLPAASAPITVTANTTTSITLYLPGDDERPTDDTGTTAITFPANGQLRYKNDATKGETYSTATPGTFNSASGTPVTFTFTSTPHRYTYAIIPGDEFYLGYVYNSSQTPSVIVGDNLILNIDVADTNDLTARIFPPQNGTIFVVQPSGPYQYAYDSRVINTSPSPHTVTLTKIGPVPGAPAPLWPLTVSNKPIYMGKSLGIRSTATYGN